MSTSSSDAPPGVGPADLEPLVRLLLEEGGLDGPLPDLLQPLLATATRAYAARCAAQPAEAPFSDDNVPTATEVAITVSAMLECVGIEPFELGIWNTWGIVPGRRGE